MKTRLLGVFVPKLATRILAVLLFVGCNAFLNVPAATADDRPNIVLIMCDDLGYADVGFSGATDIKTPSLDQLARAGTICTSGYVVHPFCGPSRMGMMAGRYPHAFGAPFNLPPSALNIEEYKSKGIPVEEVLISKVLQDAGYFTGIAGKWHMGFTPEYHPNVRGFDDFYGFLGGGHDYFPERYRGIFERQKKTGKEVFNEYIVPLEHNGKRVDETEYMTDALSREGARFINEASKKETPFFLFVSYNAPHTPLQAKEEDLAVYADIRDEKRRTYAAMVHAVDRGVGEVVEALNSTGEMKDTLIVFLSDNGGKTGAGANNGPLKRGKGSVYEGGIRVPMFFHWPNHVPAGQKFDWPVSAIDFYPTFAALGNASIPDDKSLDGKNIWDGLVTGEDPRDGEMLFSMRHHAAFSNVGIRQDNWKATCVGKRWALYDVAADPGEDADLGKQNSEQLDKMIDAAQAWSQQHTQPHWFHSTKARDKWNEMGMPNPDAIFTERKRNDNKRK